MYSKTRKINVFVGVFVILVVFKLLFVTKVNAVLIQVCDPESYGTCSGSSIKRCKSDGSGYTYTPCSLGCYNAMCKVCSSGSVRCSGNIPQVCVNGFWSNNGNCGTGVCNSGICCSPDNCGNCANLTNCNSQSGCNWNYSGNYCEKISSVSCVCGDPGILGGECTKGTVSDVSYSVSGFSWTCVAKSDECGVSKSCTATISTDACNSVGGTCKSTCSGNDVDQGSMTDYGCKLLDSSKPVCCKVGSCSDAGGSCTDSWRCPVDSQIGGSCDLGSCCKIKSQDWCDPNVSNYCQTVLGYSNGYCYHYSCDKVAATSNSAGYYDCVKHNSSSVPGVAGSCGGSDNESFCDVSDITAKCDKGSASSVVETTMGFTWSCSGTSGSCGGADGALDYCSATKNTTTVGVCPTTSDPADKYTCVAGAVKNSKETNTSTGIDYTWTCEGCTSSQNCTLNKCINAPIIPGKCNSGVSLSDIPDGLCLRGSPVNVTQSETIITWDCTGGSVNTCAEGDGEPQLGCSSIIDQESWFQVNDGDVLAKGKVNNYVPQTTCDGQGKGCASMVSVSAGGNQNGFVYGKSISIGHDGQSERAESLSLNFKTYPYSDLRNSYLAKNGVGTTFADNPSWDEFKDVQGVVFVNGNLEIKDNLDKTGFLMIIAKDTITIDSNVNLVNAVLVANNVVAAAADEDSTEEVGSLIINGMVHGVNSVKFSRSLVPKSNNNNSPSVLVNYKPELLFMIPTELSKAFSSWKVN